MSAQPSFEYLELHGTEVEAYQEALGQLRIAVFREFPYLYDGDLDYERQYLRVYSRSSDSLVVLLHAEGKLVGATTCIPMVDESPDFQRPFLEAGMAINNILYFGESIILPEFRGAGAGHEFFTRREAHARKLGMQTMAFCAVERPADHLHRPTNYRPLHAFWKRMGFKKHHDLHCYIAWKEIDRKEASEKQLTYWTKPVNCSSQS